MNQPNAAGTATGERLRQARLAAGLTLADASTRSRIPVHVLQALEDGDWDSFGAAVFVRGQLRGYARVLGMDLEEDELPPDAKTQSPEKLVSHVHVPRYRHLAESLGRRAVYVVMTAALVVPVWMTARHSGADAPAVAPLDVSPGVLPRDGQATVRTPVVASLAAVPARAGLLVEFQGDSWVQVYDANGGVTEKGLLRAGERREYPTGTVSRIVLGNAAAASVSLAGQSVNLEPYTRANVARFTLSSDGSLAPLAP